jgi:PKD repeat protein
MYQLPCSVRIKLIVNPFYTMKTCYLLVGLCLFTCTLSAQTSLSGIPNEYANMVSQNECENSITITNSDVFVPGMGILILQSSGADINLSDNSSYGTINTLNGAGQYEYNQIVSINGAALSLAYELIHNYDVAHTQVIGFQIHENASIDGLVFPQEFDGVAGGVVVIEVTNTLTINADIDVSGLGFEGGATTTPLVNNCSVITNANGYVYDASNWRGAPKGKGIANLTNTATSGRGAPANGGGGGNDHNSGGGGGALLTTGGQGGTNEEPSFFGCDGNFPGLGGRALPNTESLLFLGGGGGSGHTNNNAVSGGSGGGIIILKATTIIANGGRILANGENGQSTIGDGGSGGGAGGMIVLLADDLVGNLNISARGGSGGSVDNGNIDRCFGPGGGGSGGVFRHNTSQMADLDGGIAGLSFNSTDCADSTNGAQAGTDGISSNLTNLAQGERFAAPMIVNLPDDTLVCPDDIVILEVELDSDHATYQWQYLDQMSGNWVDLMESAIASGTQTNILEVQISDPVDGLFRLQITPTNNCFPVFFSSAIDVQVVGTTNANPTYSLIGNTANFAANVNANVNNVEWIFGFDESSTELNPIYTFPGPGTYSVLLIYGNDCESATISLEVVIANPIFAAIGASSLMGCAPLMVLFEDQSVGEVANRSWSFPGGSPATSNSASPLVTFNEVGMYEVMLSVDNGVNSSNSSITITTLAPPVPVFTVSSDGLTITLNNQSTNATGYLWNFGDGNTSTLENPSHTYTLAGIYEVSLNASNTNCGVALSQTITVFVTSTVEQMVFLPALFPNPGTDQLYISDAVGSTLQIWNSSGQKTGTYQIETAEQILNTSAFPTGLYLLQFERQGQIRIERWLKI